LLPVQRSESSGWVVRSVGYAEAEQANSKYEFSSDGTLLLSTTYGQSIAEERIWFASENVRCRSSVVRTSEGSGILQTSFASEVRRIKA
jgi:phycoerythrin-associated linker protein